ncbi:cellulose biosynthesis protein BcsG, partial [Escherichia sp. R-CC3]
TRFLQFSKEGVQFIKEFLRPRFVIRWLDVTEKDKNSRSATFYNTLPLHDGNHYPGVSKTADYKARAQKFFDELDAFFTELEKSGRKVMVVVVPEHGGALK